MAFQKKLPTSAKGAAEFVKGSGRTAVFVTMIVLGLGVFAFVLPWLKRIPLLGGVLEGGQKMLPGQSASMSVDQWGRRA